MICKSCGRANELGARFCKSCGAPLESDESMQQNNTYQSENVCQQNNQYVMPESMYSGTTRMTKKEFNECANIKSITKNITAAAIIAYVIGAITFIVNVVMAGNIAGLVDVEADVSDEVLADELVLLFVVGEEVVVVVVVVELLFVLFVELPLLLLLLFVFVLCLPPGSTITISKLFFLA